MAPTPGMTFEGLKCRAVDIVRGDHKVVWVTANCHNLVPIARNFYTPGF